MGYKTPLETRIAKKTTKAIVDFNLFFAGALKAMPARLISDNGAHVVIRPLVYVTEAEARAYCKESELPVIGCCCPACGDLGLQRQRVKRLIAELDREHPGVKASMLKALGNVKPRHLLDRRLNPNGDIRRQVSTQRDELDDVPAEVPLVPLLRGRPASAKVSSPQAPKPSAP